MARGTLEAMARGGIYDQLAGGFARYSVDAQWVVPHFEKMLYDNALLLRVYLHLWRATGDDWARRVADETAAFLIRDLGTPEGGFASALDADTNGVEGLTYVWTPDQLIEVLGPDDGRWAAEQFEVTDAGTFEHGASTLQRLYEPDDAARLESVRAAAARRPGAAAPAGARRQGGHRLERAGDRGAGRARRADRRRGLGGRGPPGRRAAGRHALGRRPAPAGLPGRRRRPARRGARGLRRPGRGITGTAPGDRRRGAGWSWPASCWTSSPSSSSTSTAGTTPPRTPRRWCTGRSIPADGPTPAGIAAAAGAAVSYGALAGSPRHRELGEAALASLVRLVGQAPRAAGWAAAVGEALLAGPLEVAVSGPAGPERDALAAAARASTSPGAVVVVGEPDAPGVPLLADRPPVGGAACRLRVPRLRLLGAGDRRVRSERSDEPFLTAAQRDYGVTV